jgi:Flp pilus assembly protein TadG
MLVIHIVWDKKMIRKFWKNESGNMTLMTALGLLPVMGVVGVAVDLAAISNTKQSLQDSIDNAALAAIHEPNRSKAARAFVNNILQQDIGDTRKLRVTKFQRRETNGNVTLEATISGRQELIFGSLLGKSNEYYKVNTKVTGDKKLSAIRFYPTYGSGFLDKEFQLWVIRPNRASPERLATYRWKSSAPITLPDNSSPGWLSSSRRGTVRLGNYTDFYMTTRISDPWDTYSHEQKVQVYGPDYTISSYEPGHGDHFVVNGRQLPREERVNFTRDFSCDVPNQNFEWEDAPGLAMPNTDFRFTVTARCDDVDPATIRIIN